MTPLTFRAATAGDIPALITLVDSAYRGEASRAGWTTEADLLDGGRIDAASSPFAGLEPESEGQIHWRNGCTRRLWNLRRSPVKATRAV